MTNIEIILSILGWAATFFRAAGMLVKSPILTKVLTSVGNLGWLAVGLIQWIALDMSSSLFFSNMLCLVMFLIFMLKTKKEEK